MFAPVTMAELAVQALTSQDGEALGENILSFSEKQTCPVQLSPSWACKVHLSKECSHLVLQDSVFCERQCLLALSHVRGHETVNACRTLQLLWMT